MKTSNLSVSMEEGLSTLDADKKQSNALVRHLRMKRLKNNRGTIFAADVKLLELFSRSPWTKARPVIHDRIPGWLPLGTITKRKIPIDAIKW